jgi:hypothetical protein
VWSAANVGGVGSGERGFASEADGADLPTGARFRNLREAWRPYLVLSKGSYDIPNQWTDLTICNIIPTKGRHPWEQSVGPFKDLVTFFFRDW